MTSVSDVTSGAGLASSTAPSGGSALGKEDFLKLLVAQLQNQDPLNPSDPTEFTAQLAQFSSLEQLFSVNSNLEKMAAASGDMERLSALNLIGKEVVSDSGEFRLGEGEVQLGYRLDVPAQEVNLYVLDASGRAVATIPASKTAAGEHFLSWNGRDANGQKLAGGEYALVVKAMTSQDEQLPATALVKGVVNGVDLADSGSILVSTAGDFQLKDVVSVREI